MQPPAGVLAAWVWSFAVVAELWRDLPNGLLGLYRPELHYGREPDPRWREKYAFESQHGVGVHADAHDHGHD
jgi:hypothetical protein